MKQFHMYAICYSHRRSVADTFYSFYVNYSKFVKVSGGMKINFSPAGLLAGDS